MSRAGTALTLVTTGAESSGKTTLAIDLAAHFRVPWVPEYAREYLEAHGPSYEAQDVEAIARGQLARERALRADGHRPVVVDTDLLVICIWMRVRYGAVPTWIEREIVPDPQRLYLLTAPEMPWEPDPLREHPDARAELHQLYREELQRRGLSWLELVGDRAQRLQTTLSRLASD